MDGTVLVADDDRTIRTVLTQALTRAGCKVHATSSLTTLMRWVGEGKGDVVISDVVMPDGNGLELLSELRERGDKTPVLILTARDGIEDRVKGLDLGADDYLAKPFSLAELEARGLDAAGSRGCDSCGPRDLFRDCGSCKSSQISSQNPCRGQRGGGGAHHWG